MEKKTLGEPVVEFIEMDSEVATFASPGKEECPTHCPTECSMDCHPDCGLVCYEKCEVVT